MQVRKGRIGQVGAAVAGLALVASFAAPSAFASTASKKKALSMPNVTVIAGTTAGALPLWIAQQQGFFKSQGVNVNWLNSSTGAANTTTVLLAGSAQFAIDSAPSQVLAAQQGAPVRGLVQANLDAIQELAINQSFATAHNIPATGSTAAGALKQLLALKGSHIRIAESSMASTSYSWLVTIARSHGLTVATNGNTADIIISTVGSVTSEIAAAASGRADGFGNVPPNTVQPNMIEIGLWRIAPATNSAGQYLSTVTTMILKHADTVQAVVTGYVQGMEYLVQHPVQAQRDVAKVWSTVGITSPETQTYLFADFVPFMKNPFPSRAAYQNGLGLINGAQPAPVTLAYNDFIVSRFVTAAGKALHVTLK